MNSRGLRPVNKPLTNKEFDRLSDFLDAVPDNRAMTIEEMDGFFCALIVGPDTVMPSEYLPVLLGDELGETQAFRSLEEAQKMLVLFTRYWNSIVAELQRYGSYEPLFDDVDQRGIVGRLWAKGFMQGVELRIDGWSELIEAENSGDLMMIAVVAGDLDPAWPKRRISRRKMHEINLLMAAAVARAHSHFLARRTPEPASNREPMRR
jgi:uncharacterized protein